MCPQWTGAGASGASGRRAAWSATGSAAESARHRSPNTEACCVTGRRWRRRTAPAACAHKVSHRRHEQKTHTTKTKKNRFGVVTVSVGIVSVWFFCLIFLRSFFFFLLRRGEKGGWGGSIMATIIILLITGSLIRLHYSSAPHLIPNTPPAYPTSAGATRPDRRLRS